MEWFKIVILVFIVLFTIFVGSFIGIMQTMTNIMGSVVEELRKGNEEDK